MAGMGVIVPSLSLCLFQMWAGMFEFNVSATMEQQMYLSSKDVNGSCQNGV